MSKELVSEAASDFTDATIRDISLISPEGNQNHTTGIVSFENEPPVFVKLCPHTEEAYRKQHMIERAILEEIDHIPFSSPTLIAQDTIGEEDNTLYYISSVLPGESLSDVYDTLSTDEKEALLWKVGKNIAQLQTHITFDSYGMFRFFPRMEVEEPATAEEFYRDKLALRLDQMDTKYEEYKEPIRNMFEEHLSAVDTLGPATISNRDLRPGNILYTSEKGLTGIIDWESVFAGHSLQTLIKSRLFFIDFPISSPDERERLTQALYEGYQSEVEFPALFEEHIEPLFELFSLSWFLRHDETFPDVPSVTTFPDREQEEIYHRLLTRILDEN